MGHEHYIVALVCIVGASCVGDSAVGGDAGADATIDVAVEAAADGGTDVVDAGPACNLAKPFGAPVPVVELNTPFLEVLAQLTHDELTVYFNRQSVTDASTGGAGNGDIMTASRSSRLQPFGAPTFVTALNTPFDDLAPSRATTVAGFGNIGTVPSLNTAGAEGQPYVLSDGLTIYFTTASYDLARATRGTTTTFTVDSTALTLVNTSAFVEADPVVTTDDLTLYFSTDRSGVTCCNFSVWKATRASASDPFGAPAILTEVNTGFTTGPSWVSDDGCRLYLGYTSSSTADSDIYVATKPAN